MEKLKYLSPTLLISPGGGSEGDFVDDPPSQADYPLEPVADTVGSEMSDDN